MSRFLLRLASDVQLVHTKTKEKYLGKVSEKKRSKILEQRQNLTRSAQ